MPSSTIKPYSPSDPNPYEAPELPQPAPPAPAPEMSPSPQQERLGQGMPSTAGKVAFYADSILKGFMKGRAEREARTAMKLKKQSDDLSSLYNGASKRLLDLAQAGVSKDDPEYQKAKGEVDAAWGAYMQFVGQHVAPPEGKKKSKGEKVKDDLLGMLRSGDPMQVSQAWYQIAQKAGPPVYSQIAAITPGDAQYRRTTSQTEAQRAQFTQELQTLQTEDKSKLSPEVKAQHEARAKQLQDALSSAAPGQTGGMKLVAPRAVAQVNGKDLVAMYPNGAPGPNGNFTPEPGSAYREIIYGEEGGKPLVRYEPMSVNQQFKTVAGPTGTPVDVNYNPIQATTDVNHPMANAPVRGEVKNVQTTDAQGNPVSQLVPVIPPYKKPGDLGGTAAAAPSSTSTPTPTAQPLGLKVPGNIDLSNRPVLHNKDGTVSTERSFSIGTDQGEVLIPRIFDGKDHTEQEAIEHYRQTGQHMGIFDTPAHADAYAEQVHNRKQSSLTPHQSKAADVAEKSAKEAGVKPPQTFPRYSKDVQGRYMAVRGQELTLNGIPGSKTDIGFRQATLNALANPDQAAKVAVAMQALDQHAKSGISGHSDGDYGYVQNLKETWNTIPALQSAFGALNSDPSGKVYLDNFFRAWTNAATIRALQGTTGRPTQSMYSMLVNELPMIGVNVANKDDATRKLDMLQDDVDVAKKTLPAQLMENVDKEFKPSPSSSSSPHAIDKKLDEIFGPIKPVFKAAPSNPNPDSEE